MAQPEFLTSADALYVHRNQIDLYGGEHGLRAPGMLESALAQPQAGFGDQYLHNDLFEMAAYLYHVVMNHPFIDGNKRTGAVLAMIFLDWNDIRLKPDNDKLVAITMKVAEGKAEKAEVAEAFRSMAH